MENKFIELNKIDVSKKVESKNGLSYLSWAWAWAEFLKVCPNAQYEIKKFNDLPYIHDARTGYMVFTTVTVDGATHEMWLPVMDNANNAMKAAPYSFKTKYKEVFVNAASMMDINKTIMRCLVKNIAMFGLGLYIYAGEDLPEVAVDEKALNGALSVTNGTRGGLTKKEFTAKIEAIKTSLNNCNDLDDLKAVWVDAQADLLIIKGLEDGLYYDILEARKNELKVNFEQLSEILEK